MLSGSNPVSPSPQAPENIALTTTNKTDTKSENQKLAEILFLDEDLRLLIQAWPELPEHIKAAIKALVHTHNSKDAEQ